MNIQAIGPGVLALLILAACPTEDNTRDEPETPVYRVAVAESAGGSIRVKPESGPEGTEILVQVQANDEDWVYIPGSLVWDTGAGPAPIDEALLRFTLPAADVTVAASFMNGGELGRRMVRVAGKTVSKKTGLAGQPFSNADTTPVAVPSFKIGAAEITYDLWYTVRVWAESAERGAGKYAMGNGQGMEGSAIFNSNSVPTAEHRYEPVYHITWGAAVVWCNAYSEWAHDVRGEDTQPVYKKGGQVVRSYGTIPDEPDAGLRGFRLPTEAEWEFAARGGDPAAPAWEYRYAGGNTPDAVAWHVANAGGKTQTVGLKAPNALGLYDMSGNAAEWCWERVHRGGGYGDTPLIISRYPSPNAANATLRVVAPAD